LTSRTQTMYLLLLLLLLMMMMIMMTDMFEVTIWI